MCGRQRPSVLKWPGRTASAAFLGYIGAGRFYGLDAVIEKFQWVRAAPLLRYVLG